MSAVPVAHPPGEAEQWFRTLAETTSTAIFVYRETFLYVNPACERLTGYPAEELLGMPLAGLVHPDFRAEVEERVLSRLRGEEVPRQYQLRIGRKDGEARWIEVFGGLVHQDGLPAGMATAVDVTDRKRDEDTLRESERWFRTMAESTATAILVYGNRRMLYVNRAFEDLTGFSLAEVADLEPWQLAHPDSQEMVRTRLEARLRGEPVPHRYEMKVYTKDGGERWVDFSTGVIDYGGQGAAVGTAIDVTERKLGEIALRESGERLELAQRVAGIVTWEWNLVTDELVVSPHAAEVLGCPPESIWATGPEFLASIHSEDQERFAAALRRCLEEHEDLSIEIRVLLSGAGERWISERARALPGPSARGGAPSRVIGVAHDITERKRAEEALHRETERAQVTLASIGDGVIRTDAAGSVDYLNPVAERLTGWPLAEAVGRHLEAIFNIVDEAGGKPLFDPVERCVREGKVIELPGYSLLIRRDGVEFAIRDSVAPIRDRQGRIVGTVLVFKDVTQLRGMEREMSYLARHDSLTGLINRREFENRLQLCLQTAAEEGRMHALFYLDLDEFKVVNDTAGHLAGDEMLKQVTALLRARLRRGDVLARLGGDEFGVLLEDTSLKRAREIAEGLRAAVKSFRFHWQERVFEVGVSIGLVPIDADSGDMVQVLSAADAACYVAKESGRNRVHEYQSDDTAVAVRRGEMQWIHRIHKAFEEQRFCLYQQRIEPLSPFHEGPGLCEIFIRMRDEQGRLASPGSFIPAAERYHLIPSIDRWVVHAAFEALTRKLAVNQGPCFAINLSGQSIGEESFLDYVVAELEASGLPPDRICFEITETAAVDNLARATRFISVLKGMGCRFVLDDFGSGLSSFAYLKNLRVDFLKIDGEFVRDMLESTVQRALVDSINQIGHVMGIRTIAEAVENQATLEALRRIGVDYAQGYCIAAPEPLT